MIERNRLPEPTPAIPPVRDWPLWQRILCGAVWAVIVIGAVWVSCHLSAQGRLP